MTWITEHATDLLAVGGLAYALARAIVALTPTPRDDEALAKVAPLLRGIAALFGLDLKQGRETEAPPTPPQT